MLKKSFLILFLLLLSAVLMYVYFEYRVPEGMTPMGDNDETIAWIALSTSIVTLITTIITLITTIIKMNDK